MAVHKQYKSSNPLEIKDNLESIVYDSSTIGHRKQQEIIDNLVCSIDDKPKSGLQRHIARHNKTIKIKEKSNENTI